MTDAATLRHRATLRLSYRYPNPAYVEQIVFNRQLEAAAADLVARAGVEVRCTGYAVVPLSQRTGG